MAQLDFGILNTNAPAQIAGAYGQGQQEARANLLAEQQLQHVQSQNALAKYQIDAARMQNEGQNALNAKYASGAFDPMANDAHLKELYGMGTAGRTQAGDILKLRADQRKEQESLFNIAKQRHDVYKQEMGALATEPDLTKDKVIATFDNLVTNGLMPQTTRDAMVAKLSDDPAALRASAMQDAKSGLKGIELLTAFLPKPLIAGGDVINANPLAPGGVGQVLGRVSMSDAQKAANEATLRGQNLTDARARDRLAAETATGTLTPQSLDLAANVYLQTGQLPTGMGKAASGMRAQVMNRATELSTGKPAADLAGGIIEAKQDVASRGQAVKAFSTGKQGQQVNAFNTAIDHLGTMDKLSDALQNGDVKAFNALGNTIARQTGAPAPTNFDAAKQIVTSEVIKAVVASGGGVTERQEAERNFANANSPAQLKGLINTYQDLLGGQLKSLSLQYKNTTGREDFDKKLTPAAQAVVSRVRGEAPAAAGANTVVTPDGQSHTFPTPAAAAQFKKAAGIP